MRTLLLMALLLIAGCHTTTYREPEVDGFKMTLSDEQIDRCAEDLSTNLKNRIELNKGDRQWQNE